MKERICVFKAGRAGREEDFRGMWVQVEVGLGPVVWVAKEYESWRCNRYGALR
jgi:hypothetical protein